MMYELDVYDYELLKKIEADNLTNYEIIDIEEKHYISIENIMKCLEDTQDNREYAEMQLKEITNKIDGR